MIRVGDINSLILFWVFWIIIAIWEEKRLVNRYQSQYTEYLTKIPFLIPYTKKLELLVSKIPLMNNYLFQIIILLFGYILFVLLFSIMIVTEKMLVFFFK
ncbi:MAG: hypothetical protein HeimC3_23920 [Candidatus Heimdallarchaeota archaeon LC_3]|nr:MAG: hypothetical protein HeimC3_23920 [Candidatus Heimdallarchaeota archaeon LC_3]